MAGHLLEQVPRVPPPLDPGFRPAALAQRAFRAAAAEGGGPTVLLALERDAGNIARLELGLLPAAHPDAALNYRFVERSLKFLLWQKGGFRVSVAGPREIHERLAKDYAAGGARAFDATFMARVYDRPRFEVVSAEREAMPAERECGVALGGHLDGCRIGFDAGGSDRKVTALIDGQEVFSCEVLWQPKTQADPQYHVDGIDDSIRRAARHLPRIDAIGVSSAGIYVNNRTRVASLFRAVPDAEFEARITNIYRDLSQKWGGVPIEVANDGDVTALAGALELNDYPVLGLALGTSQAAGYVNAQGLVTGWLNELAFAPIDYAAHAPVDREWSGDRGTGVHYLSQDAVIRLAARAGLELPASAPASMLAWVQRLLAEGEPRARQIFETVGIYLGYALLQYAEFYALKHVLLLGRVASGTAGSVLVDSARRVLAAEARELGAAVTIHLPDEATRRVGQSRAAASLPRSRSQRGQP